MDLTLFLLALTPILFIVAGVIVLRLPVMCVAVFTLIYTIELVAFDFNIESSVVKMQVISGIAEGAKIAFVFWSVFMILNMTLKTGAMDKMKETLGTLTNDRRKQAIIITVCLGGIIEGIAGAGISSVFLASILAALGVSAIRAVTAAVVLSGIAASLGAVSLSAIGGFAAFLDAADIRSFEVLASFLYIFGSVISPLAVLYILYGKKAFDKRILIFSLVIGMTGGGAMILAATFADTETATILAGILSLFASGFYIKFIDRNTFTAEEFLFETDRDMLKNGMSPLRAISPCLILLGAFAVVNFFAQNRFMDLEFMFWSGGLVFAACCFGAVILNDVKNIPYYAVRSFKSVIGLFIAVSALSAIANLMYVSGLLSIIVQTWIDMTGSCYPAAAVLAGSLGVFLKGTMFGSNMLFSPLHLEASRFLNIEAASIFIAQNTGAALGHMMYTGNILATCETVGLKKSEGVVLQEIVKPICVLWAVYALAALAYTCIL